METSFFEVTMVIKGFGSINALAEAEDREDAMLALEEELDSNIFGYEIESWDAFKVMPPNDEVELGYRRVVYIDGARPDGGLGITRQTLNQVVFYFEDNEWNRAFKIAIQDYVIKVRDWDYRLPGRGGNWYELNSFYDKGGYRNEYLEKLYQIGMSLAKEEDPFEAALIFLDPE